MDVLPFYDLCLRPRKHVRCVQHCLILPPDCARAVLEGRFRRAGAYGATSLLQSLHALGGGRCLGLSH